MSLKSRINGIERKCRELKMFRPDSVIIETGVCTFDKNGQIDRSYTRKIRVPKNQKDSAGILLVPEQRNKEQWRVQSLQAVKQ